MNEKIALQKVVVTSGHHKGRVGVIAERGQGVAIVCLAPRSSAASLTAVSILHGATVMALLDGAEFAHAA